MSVLEQACGWFDENWDPERPVGEWWELLAESGYGYPSWPADRFGLGVGSSEARAIVGERMSRGILGPPTGVGAFLGAPTLLEHGTDEQVDRYLPGIAKGTETWTQLFSEPGAGSDLASLSTRAVRDGDQFIVNGQKVWSSGAQFADLAILLARTDVDQPKHRGISFFIIDMCQAGVDVRPLVEMTGGQTFNEVFLTDAVVPARNLIGRLNDGWRVTVTTLAHERDADNPAAGGGGGVFYGRPDLEATCAAYMGPDEGRELDGVELWWDPRSTDLPARMAEQFGRTTDAVVRQDLMRVHMLREVIRFNGLRAKARREAGQAPGPESSIGKLLSTQLGRAVRDVGLAMQGPAGQLLGDDAPDGGVVQAYGLFIPAMSIAGGSDEVQRNVIGERVLGLPKEPDASRDVPYREIRVGTQRSA